MTEPRKDLEGMGGGGADKTCRRDMLMLASFGTVFVVRMLLVKIGDLSPSTLSVFLLLSFISNLCLFFLGRRC